MPFAGDYGVVSPGEIRAVPLDFTNALAAAGGSVSGVVSTSVAAYQGVDANASGLLSGAASLSGNVVTQLVGNASPGFQPGVAYRWTVTVSTTLGETLTDYMHISCVAIA